MLPDNLPDMPPREVEDLWGVRKMFDGEVVTWAEKFEAKGRAEARAAQLVDMAGAHFGDAVADAMTAMLGRLPSEDLLRVAGVWLVTCSSAGALIAKLRECRS